jgi:autotransporter-associated beta strand protein
MNAMTFSTVSQRNKFSLSFKFFGILLLVLLISGESWGQTSFTSTASTDLWNSNRWNNSIDSSPFTSAYIENNNVSFTSGTYSFSGVISSSTLNVGNITISSNVNVSFSAASGNFGTAGNVRTIDVGSGSTIDFGTQAFTTSNNTGFIKTGNGSITFGSTGGGTYGGGFTLNAGTLIFGGAVNSIGSGNFTINGGVVSAKATQSFTDTKLKSIIIGGDFTLGDATNTANITFGASTSTTTTISLGTNSSRIITLGNSATYTLWPIISGSGSGITINSSSNGVLVFNGQNTYSGSTIISGGTLKLNANGGALKSGNAVTIGGGTLEIAQSQTIGDFSMPSGTLKVDAGQTLTITGTYNVSGGTINNQGTIVLQGSSAHSFPGSSTVINNGTFGLMTNLTIDNSSVVSIDKSFSVTTLTINPNAKLTNNTGKTLTVSTFNINSSSSGTGTYLDNGTTTITGSANVQQYLSSARSWYISSPVNNAAAPTGYTYYKYDEKGNNPHSPFTLSETEYWENVSNGTTLSPKVGYIAQVASGTPTITFTGSTFNDDDFTLNLTRTSGKTKEGFNLVGNPYPSFLNIDNLASNADILKTYWIRSNNGSYVFDTYNIPSAVSTGLSGLSVSKFIPPMQAFWLRVTSGQSTATVDFLNANRGHQDDLNNKFRVKSSVKTNQSLLRLKVSNGTNTDEAVIYFNSNASNGYDAYDSPKMSNADANIPEIYTLVGNEELVINGMTTIPTTALALGFRTGESKNFTIKASEITNMNANTHIILKDNLLNIEKDITDGSAYTFSSDAVNSTTRFTVIFRTSSNATGLDNNSAESNAITVYKNAQNGISIICSNGISGQGTVSVFNTIGVKMASQALTSATTVVDKIFASGVYLVNVTYNGKASTQKIIIN